MSHHPVAADAQARWRRIRALFQEVVDVPAARRAEVLRRACPDDADARDHVERLLVHDATDVDPLADLVADAAREVAEGVAGEPAPLPTSIAHYRLVAPLGAGGMGEVFLAEDETLGRRVALKLPAPGLARDAQARDRFLREARAAAALTHPHACVVHEVGEAPDGRPFIAMEYLEGETLAARLRRGPLPADEVIALGLEAADALAEAHAHGVIHRDLKPSNIVRTPHGSKLLDFGLASLARDHEPSYAAGEVMGTVRYMSPEQLRGDPLDARSDVFALGIVLYEAATGRRPFEGATPREVREATLHATPPAPSTLGPPERIAAGSACLPLGRGFDRVVARALAKDPADRYPTTTALAGDLAALRAPRRAAWVGWRVAAAIAGVALLAWLGSPQPSTTLAPGGAPFTQVLVAEIADADGIPVSGRSLRQVLLVQLQQTPFVRVLPAAGVRETLRDLGQRPDVPLTATLAQAIAQRRGLDAWVSGHLEQTGTGVVVHLVARQGATGTVLARGRATADRPDTAFEALDAAIVQLRRQLGESTHSLRRFSTPLDRATTASTDALRAYALGREQADRGEYALALALFGRAVDIDPDFALAHQALASQALNAGYMSRARGAASRAFALRDRVSPQEQHQITYVYHLTVTGDLDRGIADARRWQQTFPQQWRAAHALSNLYLSAGDHARAVAAAREAIRLNPDTAAAYSNLGGALFALDRFDEAEAVYREAMARGFDTPESHAYLWRIAYYRQDAEAMRQHLQWATGSATWARHLPVLAATLQGRWRDARALSAASVAYLQARTLSDLTALAARYDAQAAALFGDCATARTMAARAQELATLPEEHARALLATALCGDASAPAAMAAMRATHPDDTNLRRVWAPLVEAVAALTAGQPGTAHRVLTRAQMADGAADSWPMYVRGLVALAAGDGADARDAFDAVVAHPGRTLWVPLVPLARLGRARALLLLGDPSTAIGAYQDVFSAWPLADADLPVLVAARRERDALVASR